VLAKQAEPHLKVVVGVADGEETAHAQALAEEDSTEAALRVCETAKSASRDV
jgi:hypothetical protein